ncbi:MAG TPA: hypothetical protein VFV34_00885, partial [Blastocatellia bacterium]|nr:hypothetical protein [Blastocatellia bacterium]
TGSWRDNNLSESLDGFERATANLRERLRQRSDTANDVTDVLRSAAPIDGVVSRGRVNATAERNWSLVRSDLNSLASYYNVRWNWESGRTWQDGQRRWPAQSRLTGTYRLNPNRSDDVRNAADRAVRGASADSRDRLRNLIGRRLEQPEMLAIDRNGRNVTIASSRAPQVTVEADGRVRTEQTPRGRTMRVVASLAGDQLTIGTTGDRGSDYRVTFTSIDYGQRLRVTRQFYVESLTAPVMSNSIYDKTANVAQLNLYDEGTVGTGRRDSYSVPNDTRMTTVLNEPLSTSRSREGDRFTLAVRAPSRYDGAVIEGYVSRVERTGRFAGHPSMSFRLDRIRMPNGAVSSFDGLIESVRTPGGDDVRVDSEGRATEENGQTERTLTRSGIGAALGALIGVIAGGGKGAAIGAAVGAGAGAGSVFVQGRDDLEMATGTEFTIRSAAPTYGESGRN